MRQGLGRDSALLRAPGRFNGLRCCRQSIVDGCNILATSSGDVALAAATPADVETWCPGYAEASLDDRRAFWRDRRAKAAEIGMTRITDMTVDRWLGEAFRLLLHGGDPPVPAWLCRKASR